MFKTNKYLFKNILYNFKAEIKKKITSKFLIGSSFVLSSFYYFSCKPQIMFSNNIKNNNHLESKKIVNKNNDFSLGIPEFYIFYEDRNELQVEISEIFIRELKQFFINEFPELEYKITIVNKHNILNNKIALKLLGSIGVNSLESVSNNNEPIICLNYGMCLETLNPYNFVNKLNTYKAKEKLINLLTYEIVNEYDELRYKLEYLDNPKNKVILVPIRDNEIDANSRHVLSLLKAKNNKIYLTNNKDLIEKLNLEHGCYYVYYPPKLPFTSRNLERITAEEENIDLKSCLQNNPYGLMLRYGIFRDKFKIESNLLEKELKVFEENCCIGYDSIKRKKILKSSSYAFRNVNILANIDMKTIQKSWSIPNKHYLFIWLPNYSYLKEATFEFILFDSNHLMDEVQIVTSRNFAVKNEIFDTFSLSSNLPQIFLIETKNGGSKNVYNLNYFRFPKDFNNYLKGSHKRFTFKDNNIENLTYVETINSSSFKQKVIDDMSFKEFIIEIKHEGCPTCFILGKMLDHLSQKFKKHKVNKIRFFRIDTANDLHYLGEFLATPTYLHCKKNEKGEIIQISPLDKQTFIFDLRKASNYDLSKIRYHPNIGIGNHIYQQKEYLKKNYDPDMDLEHFLLK